MRHERDRNGSRVIRLSAALLVAASLVTACSSTSATPSGAGGGGQSGNSAPPAGLGSFAVPSFAPFGGAGSGSAAPIAHEPAGQPTGKIRLANFFAPNGQPGPALDFYDTNQPAPTDKPLVANLGYGQLSDYVSPRNEGYGSTYANLYLFPAGSQVSGHPIGGMTSGSNISNAGWETGQQLTYILGTDAQGFSGGPQISFEEVDEVWPSAASITLATAPAGEAVLYVNTYGAPHADADPGLEIRIDGVCPQAGGHATGGASVLSTNNGTSFGVSPGSHTVEIVVDPAPGQGLSAAQCKAAKAATSASVNASAASPTVMLVYGPTMSSLKTVSAPAS
jgi:hypothetical protein